MITNKHPCGEMSFRARAKELHYVKCHNFCFPIIYILSMFSSYSVTLLRYKVCMAFPEICPNSSKHWANILSIYFGTNVSLQIAIESCISSTPPKWNSCMFMFNELCSSVSSEPLPSNLDSYCSQSCFFSVTDLTKSPLSL